MSISQTIKLSAKSALDAAGLLPFARRCLAPLHALGRALTTRERERYHRLLIKTYSRPFARSAESYSAFEKREADRRIGEIAERASADWAAILQSASAIFGSDTPAGSTSSASIKERLAARHAAAPASFTEDRNALARAILDSVIDPGLAPRFFDYDHLDDIVGIVGGRYCSEAGCDITAVRAVLDALCILAEPQGGLHWQELPGALRRLLGKVHRYFPKRGDVSRHVWDVIPDLAGEFMALKAESNVERFLEINREYSRRQAVKQGLWDNRELSLLRGYERDHHLLLRTLVQLIADGELTRDDEVLLIGPRHVDEVIFFRRHLGLPRTIGLDLFAYGRNEILAGDMHRMPFESDRFRLVYCAGTLSYSYDARRVIEEITRVARRPGFVFLVDAAGRKAGPDALGRSDVIGIDTLVGMFYRHTFQVLARDPGRSLAPEIYENEPCLALRLVGGRTAWPSTSTAERARSRQA